MQTSSVEFGELIRHSHTMCSKVDITLGSAANVVATTGSGELELVGGGVTIDRSSSTRRTCDLSFSDSGRRIVPRQMSDLSATEWFNPISYFEFRPYRGIVLGNGSKEYIPQGVFHIADYEGDEDEFGVEVGVQARDRSAIISANKFRSPYNISAGTDYATAIQAIVTDRAVSRFTPTFNLVSTNGLATTPAMSFDQNDDPWAEVEKMAESIGMEVFFGVLGELILQHVPSPDLAPVSAVYRTDADGVRVAPLSRKISREDARNGVIVRGNAPWLLVPVSGGVWDDDPLSATYRLGPMGERPEVIEDAMVTNTAQAVVAAQGRFNAIVGVLEQVTFSAIVDPRHTVGDVIEIESDPSGVNGRYILERLELPLMEDEPMTGMTRSRRR